MENRHPGGLLRRLEEKQINAPPPPLTSFEAGRAARSESCDTNLEPTNQLCSACSTILPCNCLVSRNSKAQWRGGRRLVLSFLLFHFSPPCSLRVFSPLHPIRFHSSWVNCCNGHHLWYPKWQIHHNSLCQANASFTQAHFEQMTNKVRKNKSARIPEQTLNEAQHVVKEQRRM